MANGFDPTAVLAANPYYLGPAGTHKNLPGFTEAAAEKTRMANPRLAAAIETGQPLALDRNSTPQVGQQNPTPAQGDSAWWGREPSMGEIISVRRATDGAAIRAILTSIFGPLPLMDDAKLLAGKDTISMVLAQTLAGQMVPSGAKTHVMNNYHSGAPGTNPPMNPDGTIVTDDGPPTGVEDAPPPEYPGTPYVPPPEPVEDAPPPEYPGTPYVPPVEDAPAPESDGPGQYQPAAAASYKSVGLKMLNSSRPASSTPVTRTPTATAPRPQSSSSSYRESGARLAAKRQSDPFAIRRR